MKKLNSLLFFAINLSISGYSYAEGTKLESARKGHKEYSPYLKDNYPDKVFFGDTHLHTAYSADAGMFGTTLTPDDAYNFAKGKLVTSSQGVKARLQRPLDFLVVSDHSENLGLAPMIAESNPMVLESEWGKKAHDLVKSGKGGQAYAMWGKAMTTRKDPFAGNTKMMSSMWQRIIDSAERNNEPGKFTAFIGYEWTSVPGGNNLHRVVVFRDNGDKASKIIPLSAYDSEDPEDLWKHMASYEKKTGGKVLAIPHNGNLSNGLMFDDVTFTKKKLTKAYAKERTKREPLYEATQSKGDGETHPKLSPEDEFANFETWDRGSFGMAKEPGMIEREYAREALKRGLYYEDKLGANPFKFGMAGGTDSHVGLVSTTEDNWFGKVSILEPTGSNMRYDEMITGRLPEPKGRDYKILAKATGAAGLTGVWARENTREHLFDSMAKREAFATTGTRIKVRVFAGWDFKEEDINRHDFALYGYNNGVPMGSDMKKKPWSWGKKAPKFLIKALKDPDWANLDRIQIIKGWLDKGGNINERVYDVVASGGRKPDSKGRIRQPVGNTVNVEEANFDNSIGAPTLSGYWEDPDFDSSERAFYYVRVLEIPTPRWTTYDAKHFKNFLVPKDLPSSIQERAYSSPVWYTP